MSAAQQALEAGNLVGATTLLDAHRPRSPGQSTLNSQPLTSDDLRGFEWYYLKNLCRGDETYTFRGHQAAVLSVAISPDGKLLASASDDQTIRLWDLSSNSNLATLTGHRGAVKAVAFSPDGTILASGSTDETVKLWDVASRKLLSELTNHAYPVTALAFLPDSKRLAVSTEGPSLKLWDIQTSNELHEFGVSADLASLTVSPDGQYLAICGPDFRVHLWNLSTFQPSSDLYEEAGASWSMAFSPGGRMLATARSDGVFLWDLAQRRVAARLKGHEGEVHSVKFSPDGKILASASGDNTIRLWDSASRQLLRVLKGHQDRVLALAFAPDGRTLVSGSWDHDVKLWALSPKEEPGVLRGHADAVGCVAFAPNDRILASASLDGTVRLWDVNYATNTAMFNAHTGGVTGVVFSSDGTTLVSCGLDNAVRFWNAATLEQLAAFPGEKPRSCLALSPDGRTLAVGGGWWTEGSQTTAEEVSFWDLASRQRLPNRVHTHEMVQTLSFSPDGKTLAVGMADDSLQLVDVASRRSVFLSTNLFSLAAWSLDDGTLAVFETKVVHHGHPAGMTDLISLFDINTRQISRRLQMPRVATRYAACSPDGKTMAIFYTTTRIKLCNVITGREVAALRGHEGFGMHLAFSHDGQTLASAGNDRTVRLWRAPSSESPAQAP